MIRIADGTPRALAFALVTLLTMLPASPAAADGRTVEIESADGFALAGTLWEDEINSPGLLLLHQCNADRSMYSELGGMLAEAGFKVLSLDFRGFADSTDADYNLKVKGEHEDRGRAMEHYPADVEAAHAFLASQGEGAVVGAMGASCGGAQVVSLAIKKADLRLLGFFSSGLSQEARRDAMQLVDRLMLFVTAEGDSSATQAAGLIGYRAGRDRAKLIVFDGDAHGYPLFDQEPDLAQTMVDWFVAAHARLETD